MPKKKNGTAQIYELRDGRDVLCTTTKAIGFRAKKEGGQFRVTNCGDSPIAVAKRRRAIPPGNSALVPKDAILQAGTRKFVCR